VVGSPHPAMTVSQSWFAEVVVDAGHIRGLRLILVASTMLRSPFIDHPVGHTTTTTMIHTMTMFMKSSTTAQATP
jgi:hypothetical protein